MPSESYIQLPTDGQGKKHRTQTETVSGESVHHPVMMQADTTATVINPATEDGNLATLAGKDFATQATLSAINNKITTVNTGAVTVSVNVSPVCSTATLSSVSTSTTSTTLKSANVSRLGLMIVNDSEYVLYLKYGATASSSSYTVRVPAYGYWEMPVPIYRGVVDGILASGSGSARVTELT